MVASERNAGVTSLLYLHLVCVRRVAKAAASFSPNVQRVRQPPIVISAQRFPNSWLISCFYVFPDFTTA